MGFSEIAGACRVSRLPYSVYVGALRIKMVDQLHGVFQDQKRIGRIQLVIAVHIRSGTLLLGERIRAQQKFVQTDDIHDVNGIVPVDIAFFHALGRCCDGRCCGGSRLLIINRRCFRE